MNVGLTSGAPGGALALFSFTSGDATESHGTATDYTEEEDDDGDEEDEEEGDEEDDEEGGEEDDAKEDEDDGEADAGETAASENGTSPSNA